LNIPLKADGKVDEREVRYQLVLKIINWKSSAVESMEKVTHSEWKNYCQNMVKVNVSWSAQKIQDTLAETEKLIKAHGGFE
jgi:hypothetical protein